MMITLATAGIKYTVPAIPSFIRLFENFNSTFDRHDYSLYIGRYETF